MTYCGEVAVIYLRQEHSPRHLMLATLNVTVCMIITPSHAKPQAVVLARMRIDFGIIHCRSSACSGDIHPPTYRDNLLPNCTGSTQQFNLARPVAQGTSYSSRTNDSPSLLRSVYHTVGHGGGRQEIGNATTRRESRNTGDRTIAPVSILTRVRPPEMQVTFG